MEETSPPRLLYFLPFVTGGLADYARAQANALGQAGVEVELLSAAGFPVQLGDSFRLLPELPPVISSRSRLVSRWHSFRRVLAQHQRLAHMVEAQKYEHVLLGSYAEYLAPFWAGPLRRRSRRGVVWGAVVHDPVRDFVQGPRWWHRRSIAAAYSFLREAFVHEPVTLDTGRPMPHLRTTVIPHGVYGLPPAVASRGEARRKLGLPADAQVWLSFGHVRDGKNLDLVIQALAQFPDAFLLVAGKEQSSGQKPVAYYQEMARQGGVASRCVWLNRFIPPDEVGNLFAACDLVLLTYSREFRSASGVLNVAAWFRKPCVASGGEGNLQRVIARYELGTWVEPDRVDALVAGLRRSHSVPPAPRWNDYAAEHTWRRNAEIVRDRMFGATT